MDNLDTARKFVDACDSAKGWEACKPYVADGAIFEAQSEPLVEVKTVEAYCEWSKTIGSVTAPGAHYDLHSVSFDPNTNTAVFVATYHAKHTGEGGPVPPTNKETHTDYVYTLHMNADGKIDEMHKIWNAPWAMRELGWA